MLQTPAMTCFPGLAELVDDEDDAFDLACRVHVIRVGGSGPILVPSTHSFPLYGKGLARPRSRQGDENLAFVSDDKSYSSPAAGGIAVIGTAANGCASGASKARRRRL